MSSPAPAHRDPQVGSFLTHFESSIDPTRTFPADQLQTMYEGRPLWSRYDLDAVRAHLTLDVLRGRPREMWRYRELLPVGNQIEPLSLNEHFSPLVTCPVTAERLGLRNLVVKDESRLPTGSFKSRGLSMAVTMAHHFGARRLAISTNGNAGGALAAYAARAGLEAWIVCPRDTPRVNLLEASLAGARVITTTGLIDENGKWVRQGHDRGIWFDVSTMKEPYRLEGKKTIGLELAEQLDWELPDVILFPTGGGTALIGMWKAFQELREIGLLASTRMPRLICCQSDGCCPLYTAFAAGERFASRHESPATAASGIRVPTAIGDFMVLDAIRASGGAVVAAPESSLETWQRDVARADGLLCCPETASCFQALAQLRETGDVSPAERVVVFNTAAAQKYVDDIKLDLSEIDLDAETDWEAIAAGNAP